MSPAQLARSARAGATLLGAVVLLAPLAVAVSLWLGGTHRWIDGIYRLFARAVLAGFGVRLVSPGDPLPRGTHFVFVSNHASHLDSLAIIASLRNHPVRFVAKQELGRLPLFGAALRATGNVFVTREDTQRDLHSLEAAQSGLVHEVSVLFFAEGTRSRTGELGAFKKGAAMFAIRAGLPLVPVGVYGSYAILPRGLQVGPGGPIAVSIGEPIETQGMTTADREAVTSLLRERVAAEVARARGLVRG